MDAEEGVRRRSEVPSREVVGEVPGKGGAMSFLAIGLGGLDAVRLVVELARLLGMLVFMALKSTV